MLSRSNKFNGDVINYNWRHCLLVVNKKFVSGGREDHKFSFLRSESNMVFLAVI